MPRKTKKQKKQADQRRMYITHLPPSIADGQINRSLEIPVRKKKIIEVITYTESDYDKKLRKFTLSDMKKTFLITSFLFILQLVIFYAYTQGLLVKVIP
ncbi:hypothetical protein A3H80_03210 [Candidatus Roizmanbacteria bacterium RIFCSPLOWO2_02_FULL_37_19]|uniref:Uncharacterized protein n=1 Tax=Candidatus Roizmanbacteria bacterium RIFCSPHIGHO2_02_FULL_37_24 TaxID=1802037 RepID=A0A1F7H1H2_9BACT|nr:MAG: hypothetical protein A2862_04280 [Candidatus Roizmanbacteria bacterium RIFCSPHIGHO2_01_FULL_38_41]OGK24706.1 MAG: hypothetical protein A3C24_01115 [Candidatus Roizmanbacteria bacterium RIFCSPHIGHO2_02_FULL_37_24]OGK33225.1 MAG: hypothetical protein A3E10_03715 [Candidatus Roizmanbacteria bacterium RIFCSPHIGHO2_12_FULL_37_23]OGK44097.1 MAG: hypothetical protein A2956_03540 [Candidatus Roizmanbacteria bacterium RIFCSPLOWO2_01_FULL_37_57]OGK54099.1 MAG: hypothetical protein A3H80_03210 [Ca